MAIRIDLEGQVAIVTGAAGGIGTVYAHAIAANGGRVVVADLDGQRANEIARSIAADRPGAAIACGVDITDRKAVDDMAALAEQAFGRIDILVNNAAYMKPIVQIYGPSLLDYPPELWQQTLDINLTGTLNCIRAVAPLMTARGAGRIINQSSTGAYEGGHAYGVSKLGVHALTVWFSQELGPKGINVNCIAPGMIDTPAGDAARPAGMVEAMTPMAPLKPVGDPEDLVGTLLYLISEMSNWVTGQIIRVDGGALKRVA